MRNLGTYLEKMGSWRLRLAHNQDSGSIRFSGSPRRNGPAAPSNLSPVHKSCPTPTLKVLPHNHLPVSSLASRERRSAYCRRTFQVFDFNAHARLTTYLKRGCVFKPDILEREIAGYSCLWLERIIPYIWMCRCIAASAFSADVRRKKWCASAYN